MTTNFDAVLFDCDGVLVDSEPITNGVLRDMLAELGWKLEPAECMRIFLGKAVKDEKALIEAHTGQPLTEEWLTRFRERFTLTPERTFTVPTAQHRFAELRVMADRVPSVTLGFYWVRPR